MLSFNSLPFGSICHICWFLGGGGGGGEGFIATVFFKLTLPLCGDLNVLVM